MQKKSHLGIYAIIRQQGRIVLIEKGRGEYEGFWDLPGGTVEFGEHPEETLVREVEEEAGLTVIHHQLLDMWSHRGVYEPKNEPVRDLHHMGAIYEAEVAEWKKEKHESDGQDSLGSRWFSLEEARKAAAHPLCRQGNSRNE
jgi:8-oxo-dGTP diphosphatase